jgi:hypothetical protein
MEKEFNVNVIEIKIKIKHGLNIDWTIVWNKIP